MLLKTAASHHHNWIILVVPAEANLTLTRPFFRNKRTMTEGALGALLLQTRSLQSPGRPVVVFTSGLGRSRCESQLLPPGTRAALASLNFGHKVALSTDLHAVYSERCVHLATRRCRVRRPSAGRATSVFGFNRQMWHLWLLTYKIKK